MEPMKKVIAALAFAVVIAGCGEDKGLTNGTFKEGWTTQLIQNNASACAEQVKQENPSISSSRASSYCTCSVTKLAERYTYKQAEENSIPQSEIEAIAKACVNN
jgi:hypothetical protein